MKLLILLSSAFFLSCIDTDYSHNINTFSVMTFNVRHRDEVSDKYTWAQRSPELTNIIDIQSPDILVLQELNDQSWIGDKPLHDSVQSLFLNELRTNKDYGVYMNASDPYLFVNDCDVIEPNSITTKTPKAIFFKRSIFKCLKSGSVRLPGEINSDGKQISRYASWVILQPVNNLDKYFVLNAHLSVGDNEPIRIESMNQLIPLINYNTRDRDCQMPIIFAGDFNALPDSKPLNLIVKSLELKDSYQELFSTINAWNKLTKRVDYILVSKTLEVLDSNIVYFPKFPASDHLPLKTTIFSNNYSCQPISVN